jgi:hypothetical protein
MGEPFRRAADDANSRAQFIKGLLVGVVAMVLFVGVLYALRPPESVPAEGAASQVQVTSTVAPATQSPSATPAPTPTAAPSAEAQCRQAVAAQAPVRRAAAAVLEQWGVHVGAMNKLVAGKISLGQATAFWNRTRVGAKRRLARYDAAVATLSNTDVSCPAEPSGAAAAGSPCRMAVTAVRHELREAAIAIATWRHHVVDMDMLRMGHLSPARATQMWMRSWQMGVGQLNNYRDARKHALSEHCQA